MRAGEMAITVDRMLAEEGTAPAQPPLLTPIQALTARFHADAGGGAGLPDGKIWNAGTASLASGQSRQGFRIGELRLMIRYEDSSELSEIGVIHRLPNAPAWFLGIANLRGKLTPVIDLAQYFRIESDPRAKRMLLVLSHGSDATGVVIDGLPDRIRWADDAPLGDAGAAPERLLSHVRGASVIAGALWFDLDAPSLLDEIEKTLGASQ